LHPHKYTEMYMDRVRLGRALGFGARAAAKTLAQAANAAMSPNPSAAAKSNATPRPAQTVPPAQPASSSRPSAGNVVAATGRMGRAVLEPVKRHSRELWLQITGSFFALLACSMAGGMWALRLAVRSAFQQAHTNHAALWSQLLLNQDLLKFYLATAAFLMFAYFAVSNFIRAARSSSASKPR
jgi:hypothetical protein